MRRAPIRLLLAGAMALGVLLATSTRGAAAATVASPVEEIDLAAIFPFTDVGQETAWIDFGSPQAETHLGRGWSRADRLPSGETVAWGTDAQAWLRFGQRTTQARNLRLRCAAPRQRERIRTTVRVEINGRRIGVIRVGRDMEEFTVPLPAEVQRTGANELALINPFMPRREVLRSSRARYALACDWIRIEPASAPSGSVTAGSPSGDSPAASPAATIEAAAAKRESAASDGESFVAPRGAPVEFFLHLPERAALELYLEVPGARDRDASDAQRAAPTLRVTLQRAGASSDELVETLSGAGAKRIDLTQFGNAIVRLSLEATGDGDVRVRTPRIRGVRATDAPAPSATAPATDAGRAARANLVLVVIDTLRADHLGTYGYAKPTSPQIDAIGLSGLVFENVVAQSSWTTPATASILTGLDPDHHGAHELGQPLRSDATTLAEHLRAAGYRTAAFVTNVNVRGELGFQRGFDEYRYFPEEKSRPGMHAPAREVIAAALDWIEDAKDRDVPFFVYLHLSEPHAPYAPDPDLLERLRPPGPLPPIASEPDIFRAASRSEEFRSGANLAYLKALYDAEIATVDRAIGTLVQGLESAGFGAATVLAITGDHGEELGDRGDFGHGHGLHRELVRVPLVVRLAGGRDAGRRVSTQARQVDVVPTLLDGIGLAGAAEGIDGTSLLEATGAGAGASAHREAFTATSLGHNEASALVTPAWKAIWRMGLGRADVEVFELDEDPDERKNVADRDPVLAGYARQSLARRARLLPRREPDGSIAAAGVVDESVRRRLEMLGYLGMGGADAAGAGDAPAAGAAPDAGEAPAGGGAADAPREAP